MASARYINYIFHESKNDSSSTNFFVSQVIILTSSYGHERKDDELRSEPFKYLATKNFKELLQNKSWMPLKPIALDKYDQETSIQIPGGGFTKLLFSSFERKSIPCVVIIKYCLEGDNVLDAIDLLNYFNNWFKLLPLKENNLCELQYPPSWRFLFGNSAPQGIY